MRTATVNANIVIPAKELVLKDSSLVINNGIISRIDQGVRYRFDYSTNAVIDPEGRLFKPGLINHHSHSFTLGLLFPNAQKPITFEFLSRNLDRHLLQGTTTVLNTDGFAAIEEVEIVNKLHPIKVKTATTQLAGPSGEVEVTAFLTRLSLREEKR